MGGRTSERVAAIFSGVAGSIVILNRAVATPEVTAQAEAAAPLPMEEKEGSAAAVAPSSAAEGSAVAAPTAGEASAAAVSTALVVPPAVERAWEEQSSCVPARSCSTAASS